MLVHSIFSYFFSIITVFSAIMVVISKNTIYSVFFLILVFVTVSTLFIMIGAEFLGMIMLIVYVGAVAVLFLFVVMMLNITSQKKKSTRKGFLNNLSVGIIIGLVIFLELIIAIGGWKYKNNFMPLNSSKINFDLSNTHQIGNILYTDYIFLFQISAMILLVAMIGAITLTFRKRENIKRQSYFEQIQREKASGVILVDVDSDKGVDLNE